jgi:hypothetical protein
MMIRIRRALCACALLLPGCGGAVHSEPATPVGARQQELARPAVAALQRGAFPEAAQLAGEGVAADETNPYPHLVWAITRYEKLMRRLVLDGSTLMAALDGGVLNQKYLHATLHETEAELAAVEADLAAASRRSGISLELCLACWELNWSGNGRIDERDRQLFQIERDEVGEPIPEGDPRRKPTFRLDDGDVAWARAFVSFERAALDVLLAYDWSELAGLARRRSERPDRLVLRLVEPERIAQAKQRLLEGLAHSDASRRAYLAETDDDREWVPSPRQRSHPMPLPVDSALYDTWSGVVGDLRRLVEGEEGLGVADAMDAAGERMHHPASGYLDVGRLLAHPKDITLDLVALRRLEREHDTEGALTAALGEYYVRSMKPSPLPRRLARMKREIDRGEEGLGRKLRYLFWIN